MPRGKRTYIVATEVEEFTFETDTVARCEELSKQEKPFVVYSVLSAHELTPVWRLEKAGSDD